MLSCSSCRHGYYNSLPNLVSEDDSLSSRMADALLLRFFLNFCAFCRWRKRIGRLTFNTNNFVLHNILHNSTCEYTHTHTRLTALCPGLPRWASTRKVKPIWISLKQETVSGSGISWAVCKSAPCSRQITTPAPHHSVFTGRMPFLPPNQQRQSTDCVNTYKKR